MVASIRQVIASITVALLVSAPLSAGLVMLSAEDALAKQKVGKKSKLDGKGAGSAKVKAKSSDRTKKKANRPEKSEKSAKSRKSEDRSPAVIDDRDILSGMEETEIAYGNPGNDKAVGRAGEAPNGDETGWGEGTRGRSDAESDYDGSGEDEGTILTDLLKPGEISGKADQPTHKRDK